MSNQSDSSSSSSARPLGIQSVQYETLLSRDDQDQTTRKSTEPPPTTKRGLITKNAGHSRRTGEKRRRELSTSTTLSVKRESIGDFNDEVRCSMGRVVISKFVFRTFRKIRRCSVRDVELVEVRRLLLDNVLDLDAFFEARPSSKYCSDKCGLELARK